MLHSQDESVSTHLMPFGAETTPDGVRFRLYAPAAESIRLELEGRSDALVLDAVGGGWHERTVPEAAAGTRYRYLLPDGTRVPDPASRFQPEDIAGPSEVIDPGAFSWTDAGWRGRPWSEAVLYELHVGTFTPEGTLHAAKERLQHLADVGVTAIELMTISDFPGTRGWGYDGVLPYAPDSAYGRPEDLKAFIDAAHALQLQVIFDVVYNHFGPEGNYLPKYFPQLCSRQHDTAWGKGFNFDGEGSAEVRAFFLHNACYWVEEFHADGLRLDASHAMVDHSPRHILDELAERVRATAGERQVHLILEDEQNESQRLMRASDGSIPAYTAQWNHDMSHLLSAAFGNVCAERDGNAEETRKVADMLAAGYVLTPTAQDHPEQVRCKVPPNAYIGYTQTHDLIGNRIDSKRLHELVPREANRAITAILLLLPQTPMLFMGQEWAASALFPFFCDYHGDLAEKVREGRCAFLEQLHGKDNLKDALDPGVESTFRSAQLNWNEIDEPEHAAELSWFRAILTVRLDRVVPMIDGLHERCGTTQVLAPGAVQITWKCAGCGLLTLSANLCSEPGPDFVAAGHVIWSEGAPQEAKLGPWGVRWSVRNDA